MSSTQLPSTTPPVAPPPALPLPVNTDGAYVHAPAAAETPAAGETMDAKSGDVPPSPMMDVVAASMMEIIGESGIPDDILLPNASREVLEEGDGSGLAGEMEVGPPEPAAQPPILVEFPAAIPSTKNPYTNQDDALYDRGYAPRPGHRRDVKSL